MSPRFIRVTVVTLVIIALFAAAYILVPRVGTGHKNVDTAGKIVYLSDHGTPGFPHVWIVNEDGTGAKELTPGDQSCTGPVFSPDGSQIAYISDKEGTAQVWLVDADGTNAHAVTFGSAAKESPEFSPDGKILTYIVQGTLTALDLQSSDTQLILPPPSGATSSSTSALIDVTRAPVVKYYWSPATSSNSNQSPEIAAVQESEDSSLDVLTLMTNINAQPKVLAYASSITAAWSPDGTRLYVALLGTKVGPTSQDFSGIITFSSAGSPVQTQPLAAAPSAAIGPIDPSVSPDGTQVLFSVIKQPSLAEQHVIGLFAQAADASSPPKEIARGSAIAAQWSPDGSRILLLAPVRRTAAHDLWVITTNGTTTPINVTNGNGDVGSADWSPTLQHSSS